RVYRTLLAEPGAPPANPASCPVVASPQHATLTSKALKVRLTCRLGCGGSFRAWIGTAGQLRTHKGGTDIGHEPYTGEPASTGYSISPGAQETLTLLPSEEYEEHPSVRGLRRQLRAHAHPLLVLYCETSTPSD